jgi:CheY-like chemotaxis protein
MIEQVLMNLAINARDAMPRGGRLTISLDRGRPSPDRASARPSPEPTHVCLTVTDTGSGIDADTLPRIFEPFFTTKEVGRGTGLGLATVFGIVEQHRGSIEVESTVGEGTSFRVFLPAIAAASPSVESAPNAQSVVGGTETILLVEDEAAVRSLVRSALHRYGYSVVEADSAAAALALWEREGRAVQLLVTDLIMPGMTGRLLADRLRAVRPDLRVLYITGYSPDIVAQTLKLEEPRALLQKPFGIAELARAVRRALDAG